MKHTPEEIKYRLSDLGVQIGNIAIEYITELEKENAELKQAKEGKVVEHFEAYGQCRDSRRIAELEKENAELKTRVENQKSFLERIKAKFELSKIDRKEIEGYLESEQLTKAREIIRDFLSVAIDYIDKEDKNYSLIEEGQQLLSEVES